MALPHVPLPIVVLIGIILVLCLFLWLIHCLCRRHDSFSPNSVSLARRQSAADSGDCPICLSELDHPRVLPCAHQFHAACIDEWLRTKHTCPLCRYVLRQPDSGNQHAGADQDPGAGEGGWLGEYLHGLPYSGEGIG